jgi:hypothetical protein
LIAVAAGIIVVAFAATVAGSTLSVLTASTRSYNRTNAFGEFAVHVDPDTAAELGAEIDGAYDLSLAEHAQAVLEADDQLIAGRLVSGDLSRELEFRRLAPLQDVRSRDLVILGNDQVARFEGRVVRVTPLRGAAFFARVRRVVPTNLEAPVVLAERNPEEIGEMLARVHGGSRSIRGVPEALRDLGFQRTNYASHTRRSLRPLQIRIISLLGALFLLAGVILMPAQVLLARKHRSLYLLLHTWGYPSGTRFLVTLLSGGMMGLIGAVIGASAGLLVASMLNASGVAAIDLLPYEWLIYAGSLPTATAATATPSVGWAVASSAFTALLGVVAAWPAAAFSVTMVPHGSNPT